MLHWPVKLVVWWLLTITALKEPWQAALQLLKFVIMTSPDKPENRTEFFNSWQFLCLCNSICPWVLTDLSNHLSALHGIPNLWPKRPKLRNLTQVLEIMSVSFLLIFQISHLDMVKSAPETSSLSVRPWNSWGILICFFLPTAVLWPRLPC